MKSSSVRSAFFVYGIKTYSFNSIRFIITVVRVIFVAKGDLLDKYKFKMGGL